MRSLLLALFVGLAVATHDVSEQCYRPGREYLYQYETQVITGIIPSTPLHSGFKFSTWARVQFETASKIWVQWESTVLYFVEQPVVQIDAERNLLPDESLREWVGPEADVIIRALEIPFGFEYSDGHIMRVILDDRETEWSGNAKRGFVSLFQLNLEKRLLLENTTPITNPKMPPHTNVYTVFEASTTGDCATVYTVQPTASEPHLYVTKVRDYQRCVDRPIYLSTIFDGRWSEEGRKDSPLSNQANVEYSVKGTVDDFMILSAIGEEIISYVPYGKVEEVRTTLNQTLYLKADRDINDAEKITPVVPGKHKKDTLRMTLPSKPVDPQQPFWPSIEEPKQVSNPADVYPAWQIIEQLWLAAENTAEITSQESLSRLRVAVDMLRTSPEPVLREVWDTLYLSKVQPEARLDQLAAQILWNTLPQVGTDAAANLILDICTVEDRMTKNCTLALNVLTLKVIATPQLMEKLIKLITERQGRITPELRQVAYLSLGSFAYKLSEEKVRTLWQLDSADDMLRTLSMDNRKYIRDLVTEKKQEVDNKRKSILNIYRQTSEIIINFLRKLLEEGTTQDKILALKAIGNAGLPQAIPVLKKITDNPSQPQFIRIMAILAYRRIFYEPVARDVAQKNLLDIYLNYRESNEVRSIAFITLMNLKPELPIYERIADNLDYEKDLHVSSFVLSYLQTFANSTYQPIWPLIRNCSIAAKTAPAREAGWDHSFFQYAGKYFEDYRLGTSGSIASIGSWDRYEGWALNWDTYTYGLYSKFMEVGVNTEAMSQFLSKLFGPRGLLTSNKSIFDLLKRSRRDISPQDMIQRIFRELKIKPRNLGFPSGHLYFKMMGNELRYWDFTDVLRAITTEGQIPITFDNEGLRAGLPVEVETMLYLFDTQLTLPTEAGLPVSLKLQVSSTVKVLGSVWFKVNPFLLEEDRQGRPPVEVNLSIDLKPNVVVGIYGSMGLDFYWAKATMGFHSLMKYSAPIHNEITYDVTYRKWNIVNYVPQQETPLVEVLSEPMSEWTLFTLNKETPVMWYMRNPVYTPVGQRVKPIYWWWPCELLGYAVEVNGQLPTSWRWWWPFQPFSGRLLLNTFLRPLENAPKVITIWSQVVLPLRTAVANSYAQTYQEVLTSPRQDYSPDVSEMPDSGVLKFDKYGRPLPTALQDIIPVNDPIDLSKDTINMRQMAVKLQRASGKPVPFTGRPEARALVITVDASSEATPRHMQLESYWSKANDGQIIYAFLRLWRSAIPDYDPKPWELISDFGLTYPIKQYQPRDIFSVEWQREIMRDLDAMLGFDANKVVNQILNRTILSVAEHLNYPAMVKVPVYRVLDGLIPEQMYKLMNTTEPDVYSWNWNVYWRNLGPIAEWVREESKLVLDPYFINRDTIVLNNLEALLTVQRELLGDLQRILQKTIISHAELPVVQAIVYTQAKVVYFLEDIITRDIVKGVLHEVPQIRSLLDDSKQLCDTIIKTMSQILFTVSTVSPRWDPATGDRVLVTQTSALRKIQDPPMYTSYAQRQSPDIYQPVSSDFASVPSIYNTPSDSQGPVNREPEYNDQSEQVIRFDSLIASLYNLSLFQMEVIEDIQLCLTNKKDLNLQIVNDVIWATQRNITYLDRFIRATPIYEDIVIENLLLVTVQNEFLMQMLEIYQRREGEHWFTSTTHTTPRTSAESWELWHIKAQSYYLGPRVSYLYKSKVVSEVVFPELKENETPIWRNTQSVIRNLIVELRLFEVYVAYNKTAMSNPILVAPSFQRLISRVDSYITQMVSIRESMIQLSSYPTMYLVTEYIECINFLKWVVEFGRQSTLPLYYQLRFGWIRSLDRQATEVEALLANLYPVFDKYVYNPLKQPVKDDIPILNTIPVDVRVLDIQDVIAQQNMMLREIRKFLQDPHVTSEVLQHVMVTVLDRSQILQQKLTDSQVQVFAAMEQKHYWERYAVSTVFTQAINQQRIIYEIVRASLSNRRDMLQNVAELTQKVTTQEYALTRLESDHNQKLYDLQRQDEEVKTEQQRDPVYNDDYQIVYNERNAYSYDTQNTEYEPSQLRKRIQPLTPWVRLPTGITGLWNVTWGNEGLLNKNWQLQIIACRTVEQNYLLFKQLDALIRWQDLVYAVNQELMGWVWNTERVVDALNSYDHWHLINRFEPQDMPNWWWRWTRYTQEYMKVRWWDNYWWEQPLEIITPGNWQGIIDISTVNKKWDWFWLTDKETDLFLDVPVDYWWQAWGPNKNYKPIWEQWASYYTANFVPTTCYVNGDKVQTYDKVSYWWPWTTDKCRSLLTMDCSSEKTFAVTMVKSNSTCRGHTLEIANDDKIIEIIPGYLEVEVRVNGEVIVLPENQPIFWSKQLAYQLFEPSVIIWRRGLRVEVSMPLTGIDITVEGAWVEIQVSQLFKKKLCGLCSNFDTQRAWEYEGPQQEVYTSWKPFIESWVLHDATCPANWPRKTPDFHPIPPPLHPDYSEKSARYEEIMRPYRPKESEPKFDIDDDEDKDEPARPCKPIKTIDVRQRHKKQQICVSVKPIPKCPLDCPDVVKSVKKVVPYLCVSVDSPHVNIMKEAAMAGILETLTIQDSVIIKRRITVDIRCKRDSSFF